VEVMGVLGNVSKLGALIMNNCRADRMERGKGLTCALSRVIKKVYGWGPTFAQKVGAS